MANSKHMPGHSLAMAEVSKSELAHDNALAAAKVLALTACELLADPELLAAAREKFQARANA